MPHFMTLPKQVSNIVLGVTLTNNSDAQKHIISLKVKGIVPSPIHARYVYGHELDKPQSIDCLYRHDATRKSEN